MRHEYTIPSGQAGVAILLSGLQRLGFGVVPSPGAFGIAMRLGSVDAEVTHIKSDRPRFTLEGPPSGLSPVLGFLSNTGIGESQRSLATLLKSRERQEAETHAARLETARAALADVQQRQITRAARRARKTASWRMSAADAGTIETRLSSAGWQLASGDDGMPIWTFGDAATVAIRDAGALGLSEITLSGAPAAFGAGARLITSGKESTWEVNRARVQGRPMKQSMADHLSPKARQRIADAAELLIDSSDEQIRHALSNLSKARRRGLHESLA